MSIIWQKLEFLIDKYVVQGHLYVLLVITWFSVVKITHWRFILVRWSNVCCKCWKPWIILWFVFVLRLIMQRIYFAGSQLYPNVPLSSNLCTVLLSKCRIYVIKNLRWDFGKFTGGGTILLAPCTDRISSHVAVVYQKEELLRSTCGGSMTHAGQWSLWRLMFYSACYHPLLLHSWCIWYSTHLRWSQLAHQGYLDVMTSSLLQSYNALIFSFVFIQVLYYGGWSFHACASKSFCPESGRVHVRSSSYAARRFYTIVFWRFHTYPDRWSGTGSCCNLCLYLYCHACQGVPQVCSWSRLHTELALFGCRL